MLPAVGTRSLVSSLISWLVLLGLTAGCPASDGDASDTDDGATTDAVVGSTGVGETSATASASGESGDAGEDGSTGDGPPPMPTMLPTPTGPCPEIVDGDVTFAPAGIEPRDVRIWRSDAADTMDGPLVLYWHGTGSQPLEATYGLGQQYIDQVLDQGGVIAAPYHDPGAGDFPWYLVLGSLEDDILVADEVVACTIEQLGVDVRRIHTIGMSAGGLQTSQYSIRRSGYVASAVPYSGGLIGGPPPDQDPAAPMASMMFHGGPDDIVVISFQQASENYLASLQTAGRFGFICDHGMGHTIPQGAAQAAVWQFFYDHPFGTAASPYEAGLPGTFPDYCALP